MTENWGFTSEPGVRCRLGSRTVNMMAATTMPGRPTTKKVNCQGATVPTMGRATSCDDFAQVSTAALTSDAMPAPRDRAAE